MEKVKGIELEQVWHNLCLRERFEIVKTIASYQEAWCSTSFKHLGSIYFLSDLDPNINAQPLRTYTNGIEKEYPGFAVGPSAGREYFDDGRHHVNFDKGPCQYDVNVLRKPHCKLTYIQGDRCRVITVRLEIVKPLASVNSLACQTLPWHCTGQVFISRRGRRSWKLSRSTLSLCATSSLLTTLWANRTSGTMTYIPQIYSSIPWIQQRSQAS